MLSLQKDQSLQHQYQKKKKKEKATDTNEDYVVSILKKIVNKIENPNKS